MEISSSTANHQPCILFQLGTHGMQELMNAGVSPTKMEPMQQSTGEIQTQATVEVERKPRPHPDKAIDCPRCCSTDTKFCYYNNYSMSQPRYFCKACRRYWTQGGSLRNVPIGGGCRKNRRSSTSTSSSAPASLPSAAALQINKLTSKPMAPPSFSDFPNVLPTFTSTGFELPTDHLSLAFGSSSSNPAATLPPGGTFLDMLRGGLLDGNHQSNDFYGPTGGNVMVMPPSAFGLIMQQHGLGGTVDHTIGGAAATQEEGGRGVKAMTGLQRPSQLGGGVGSACGQLQQGTVPVHNNNVMMDNNNNNGSSRDCYWHNSFAGVGTASNTNPWQDQDLINSRSSSLI